jgi:ElaB/YqjD/DUF883 family membrane-anchored ribosome-binding protein
MDHRRGQSQQNIEAQPAPVTANTGGVEEQVQEAVEGLKATVHSGLEGFKQLQETVDEAKGAVDTMLERVKDTTHEMVERVKPVADLLDQVQQHPWLLMGSALLMGYILGSLASKHTSSR